MKITDGLLVELNYVLKLDDGTVVEDSAEEGPLVYLHGNEELPARLEEALAGSEKGAELELTLSPGDAFGEYDVEAITTVPRAEFPPDAEIAQEMWIQVAVELEGEEGPSGEFEIDMRVVEVNDESVVLDANHPLAGKTVLYTVEVRDVRQPTEAEATEHREQHCCSNDECGPEHEHGGPDCNCEH